MQMLVCLIWLRLTPPTSCSGSGGHRRALNDVFACHAAAASFPPSADIESKTLQGVRGELLLDRSGLHQLENTSLDFQKLSDKEILRIAGPLGADFTVKVRAELFV